MAEKQSHKKEEKEVLGGIKVKRFLLGIGINALIIIVAYFILR